MADVVKEPMTKEEKTKRILLVVLSVFVALVILGGFIFGSPYSIKRNKFASFEQMMEENYDKPTIVYCTRSSYCPNCNIVTPRISQIKDKFSNEINFYQIVVDGSDEDKEVWGKYHPSGIPSNKDGVPAVIYFYARKSPDEPIKRKYAFWGQNDKKNTYDDILSKVESLLADPYAN